MVVRCVCWGLVGGTLCSPLIRPQSSVSLCLWTELTNLSQFSSLHCRWDRMAEVGWSWTLPLPGSLGSDTTLQVRLWLMSFPWGQTLWRGASALAYFKTVPLPCMKGFFSDIYCRNVVGLLEVKLTQVWEVSMMEPPGVFNSQTGHLQLLSYLGAGSCGGFSGQVCSWKLLTSCIHLTVSPVLWGSSWPCVLASLMDPRRILDFSVCLGWSGDF